MDDVSKLQSGDWVTHGLPRAFCSQKDSAIAQESFRLCNEALGRLGPVATDQYPLAMLFGGSYVRIGTDVLPSSIGANTEPTIGDSCFDLEELLDVSGMSVDTFLVGRQKEALSGHRTVTKTLMTRTHMVKEVILVAIGGIATQNLLLVPSCMPKGS